MLMKEVDLDHQNWISSLFNVQHAIPLIRRRVLNAKSVVQIYRKRSKKAKNKLSCNV